MKVVKSLELYNPLPLLAADRLSFLALFKAVVSHLELVILGVRDVQNSSKSGTSWNYK
jgi:hypothetical protein